MCRARRRVVAAQSRESIWPVRMCDTAAKFCYGIHSESPARRDPVAVRPSCHRPTRHSHSERFHVRCRLHFGPVVLERRRPTKEYPSHTWHVCVFPRA